MRKALPFLGASLSALGLVWAMPALAQDQAAQPFKDLDPKHWAYEAVTDLQSKGILLGYPNGYFQGKRTLTRYEFAIAIERLLTKFPAGPKGDTGATGPPGDKGDQGIQGPPGITPDEIAEIRHLLDEFHNELTALGTDVRGIRSRLDALAADVADLRRQWDRAPKISGEFFTGVLSTRSRFGIIDYGGALHTKSNSLFENVRTPEDFHLGIMAKLPNGITGTFDVVSSNYLPYRGGTLTGVPTSAPNAALSQVTTLYQAYLDIPIGGFGSNTSLLVGRYKNQVTPLTFWRPDYDPYFDLPWYDDGNYVQDGIKFQSKFGSATTYLWAASHNSSVGNGIGSPINQPLFGALPGGPRTQAPFFAAFGNMPYGIANQGQIFATQSAGLHVGIPLFKFGELGMTIIDLSSGGTHTDATGAAVAVPYNNMVVYGANLKLNDMGRFKVSAEAAKSVTGTSISNSDGLSNDDNNAYMLNAGWGGSKFDVQAGYQYVDPRFSAPGYWNKIGDWYNPTNIAGPFVRVGYSLTSAIHLNLGGDILQGARNRSAVGSGSGFGIGDGINRVNAGLKWNLNKKVDVSAEYEGVFWDLGGTTSSASGHNAHPVEQFITFGAGLNLTSNTVLKVAYQIINYQDVGGGFTGVAGSSLNGSVFTTQVAVHF
jgi:hypothetical protein